MKALDVLTSIVPVWVQVLWSESGEFDDNELVPYIQFEERAFKAAKKHGYDGGYYKTKVNVMFSNGDNYECRLDLAPRDTHGFTHHAKRLISWFETNKGNEDDAEYHVKVYKANYDFLKQVDWPE